MQPDGFVKLADILAKPKLKNQWKVGLEHVIVVVNDNDKKRFEL
jgi:RNA:NAD 2'-phosphotransferase (TPT1/KptA family)